MFMRLYGQVTGVRAGTFVRGDAASQINTNEPLTHFVRDNNVDGILAIGLCRPYIAEFVTLTMLFLYYEGFSSPTEVIFERACPFVLAILNRPTTKILSALIAIYPAFINVQTKVVMKLPDGSSTENLLSTFQICQLLLKRGEFEESYGHSLFYERETYSKILESLCEWHYKFNHTSLLYDLSIHGRFNIHRLPTQNIIDIILALTEKDLTQLFLRLAGEDMYELLLYIGNTYIKDLECVELDDDMDYLIPQELAHLFDGYEEDDGYWLIEQNLLQWALARGKMKASAALAVLCPQFMQPLRALLYTDEGMNNPPVAISLSELVRTTPVEMDIMERRVCEMIISAASQDKDCFPALSLPTVAERIDAAGLNPDELFRTWYKTCTERPPKKAKIG